MLAYADYVNLGQGFQFFEENKKLNDIENKSYIVHEDKRHGEISNYINWDNVPLVQITKKAIAFYILWAVGQSVHFA